MGVGGIIGCCCQTWMFKSSMFFTCINQDNFLLVKHIHSPTSRISRILGQPSGVCSSPPVELPGGQSSTGKIGISAAECSVFCRNRCPPADFLLSEMLRGMSLFSNCSVTLSASSLMAHKSSELSIGVGTA